MVSASSESHVYSLDLAPDPDGSKPSLTPLDVVFEGQSVAGFSCESLPVPVLESDVADEDREPVFRFQDAAVVHFQVLHSSPYQMHTVPMPRASGRKLSKGQMAISVHALVSSGDGLRRVALEPVAQGKTCVAILSNLASGNLENLQETFTQFSLDEVAYNVKGFKPQGCLSCSAAVTQLVRCGAFPGSAACCKVTLQNGCVPVEWAELEAAGLVELSEEGEAKSYKLTSAAVASLQVFACLDCPRLVCEPRGDVALADCTVYELVRRLEAEGWTWSSLPSNAQKRRELCHSADAAKIWYSTASLPNAAYLQCLLDADRLRGLGVVSIPHWSPRPLVTYKRLLQGELGDAPARARVALLDDVDVGQGLPQPVLDQEGAPLVVDCPGQELEDPLDEQLEESSESPVSELDLAQLLAEMEEVHDEQQELEAHAESLPRPAPAESVEVELTSSSSSRPRVEQAPLLERAAPSARLPRNTQRGTVTFWGCFRMSRLAPKAPSRPYGAIEAVCPFHMLNDKSECKKYVSHKSSSDEQQDLDYKAILHWCAQAHSFNRQRHHVGTKLLPHASARGLTMEVLNAQRIDDPPANPPIPDSTLDAEAEAGDAPLPPPVSRRVRSKRPQGNPPAPASASAPARVARPQLVLHLRLPAVAHLQTAPFLDQAPVQTILAQATPVAAIVRDMNLVCSAHHNYIGLQSILPQVRNCPRFLSRAIAADLQDCQLAVKTCVGSAGVSCNLAQNLELQPRMQGFWTYPKLSGHSKSGAVPPS